MLDFIKNRLSQFNENEYSVGIEDLVNYLLPYDSILRKALVLDYISPGEGIDYENPNDPNTCVIINEDGSIGTTSEKTFKLPKLDYNSTSVISPGASSFMNKLDKATIHTKNIIKAISKHELDIFIKLCLHAESIKNSKPKPLYAPYYIDGIQSFKNCFLGRTLKENIDNNYDYYNRHNSLYGKTHYLDTESIGEYKSYNLFYNSKIPSDTAFLTEDQEYVGVCAVYKDTIIKIKDVNLNDVEFMVGIGAGIFSTQNMGMAVIGHDNG